MIIGDILRMSLVCSSCGKVVETLPMRCGYSITMNSETNQMECNMGNCGIIAFNKFLCENCCINKSILKIYNNYEILSLKNQEFHEELKEIKYNIVQTKLSNPDFNYISLRGNAVLRWEYMPGSTLYLVWTQSKNDVEQHGDFYFDKSMNRMFDLEPDNIFMMKLSYWLGI